MGREQSQEKIGAIKNVQAKSVVTGTAECRSQRDGLSVSPFSRPVKKNETTL